MITEALHTSPEELLDIVAEGGPQARAAQDLLNLYEEHPENVVFVQRGQPLEELNPLVTPGTIVELAGDVLGGCGGSRALLYRLRNAKPIVRRDLALPLSGSQDVTRTTSSLRERITGGKQTTTIILGER